MPELSEMIRDHVDAVAPHVTLEDVWALTRKDARRSRSEAASACPGEVRRCRHSACRGSGGHPVDASSRIAAVQRGGNAGSRSVGGRFMAERTSARSSRDPLLRSDARIRAGHTSPGRTEAHPVPRSETLDTWVAPNGSGRQRITYAPDTVVLPSQRAQWDTTPPRVIPSTTSDTTFPTTFSGRFPRVATSSSPKRSSRPTC